MQTAREVTAAPRHEIVGKVQAALARVDDDAYLRSVIDYIQLQPDMSKLVRRWNLDASPNLRVNSWVKLRVYDADFGWGRPAFMGPACLLGEGMAVILPRPIAVDGLLLVIALHTKAMERFKGIFYNF